MPVLTTGQSAVIAAETGSGKTLSYLAPVASMLLRQKERMAEERLADETKYGARRGCVEVQCVGAGRCGRCWQRGRGRTRMPATFA